MSSANTYRGYRSLCAPKDNEKAYQVVLEQSDLLVISSVDLRFQILDRLFLVRRDLINYITLHPEFSSSLHPVKVSPKAPLIVRKMAEAAEVFGVGPMAAVAGAIAQDIADHFQKISRDIIVENGGDIYLHSNRSRTVALLPHPEEKAALGLRIDSREFPCSVCSSSATIGHSLSLGRGDLVAVKAGSGAMADAAATALCNLVRDKKSLAGLEKKVSGHLGREISGVLAQLGQNLAVIGDMELTAL